MGASRSSSGPDYDMPTSVTRPWAPLQEPRHEPQQELRGAPTRERETRPRTDAKDGEQQGLVATAGGLFVVRVIKRYAAANGGTYATNIAWNTLFAFFPIILLITTILTAIFGGSDVSTTIDKNIQSAIPGTQGQEIVQALHSFKKATGPLLIVSFVGLAWSGTSLFSAFDQGLNALYPAKQRDFIRQKLMGIFMIVVFTILVALDVGTASLLSLVTDISAMPSVFRSGAAATLIQIAFGIFDGLLLFGAIFYIVPNRKQRMRDILPGALTAAVLFEAFTLLFPLFFKLQHGFSTYGQTFALFFLLLTFAFWLAQIVMLGAAVNAERHQDRAWPHGAPDPA
jgi:membrane protein